MNPDGSNRKTIVTDCHLPDGIVGRLSIDFPEHNIERTDDRRDVGQHVAAAQEIHCLQVSEGGRPDLAFVGLVGAIRDEIDTELSLGRLDSSVNLAGRNTMTFTI